MAWIYLICAGLLEIVFALGLKYSEGFTRLWPSLAFVAGAIGSFFLLSTALRTLPVGAGYAVWTGIGAAGTAIIGMVWLGESRDVLKLFSLLLLVCGIIDLRFTSGH